MSRKIITCMIALTMIFSVFCFPMIGYGAADTGVGQAAPKTGKTTGVKAKAINSRTIKLTWKKVTGASGYEIYRYSPKKKRYGKIKTTKKTSFKNSKLQADTAYRYKVKAYIAKSGKKYYGSLSKSVKARTKKSDSQKVVAKAKKKIGASYRSGGSGPKAFDCSGFVYWVYKNAKVDPKKKVKRTSSSGLYRSLKKYKVGSSIRSIKKAKAGDIILFKRGGHYGHAAIYAGKGKIIHAANARKGVISQSVKQLHNSGTRVAAIIRVVE